jgi:hypothetical protein
LDDAVDFTLRSLIAGGSGTLAFVDGSGPMAAFQVNVSQ